MSTTIRSPQSQQVAREAYLSGGMNAVEGWLHPFSARAIAVLSDIQIETGVHGAVGEIGVHHGKLFIVLYLTRSKDERAFAVDVVGQQELNTDRSGRGDEARFISNLDRHAGGHDAVEIFACDSNALTAEEVTSRAGICRIVSIDGGHTADTTENDLRLCADLLAEGGIAIIDDYFHPLWPDVSCGVARYLMAPGSTLAPFMVTPNKLFLCRPTWAGRYADAMRQRFRWDISKESRMFGADVVVLGIMPEDAASRVKLKLSTGPFAPYLRPIYRSYRRLLGR